MNALFSFGISFLIRLFAGLPAPGLSPGLFSGFAGGGIRSMQLKK